MILGSPTCECHLDALGAEHQRRRGRPGVAEATCGDDGQVDGLGDEGKQHHRRRAESRFEAAAFDAFDDECVDACVCCLARPLE